MTEPALTDLEEAVRQILSAATSDTARAVAIVRSWEVLSLSSHFRPVRPLVRQQAIQEAHAELWRALGKPDSKEAA
jgi:hypothetical protein